jgi:plastocyanin
MRGLTSLLVLGVGLVLAAPALAANQTVTFANYAYNPTPTTIKTGDTATFSGNFMAHPLAWDAGVPATTDTGPSKSFSFSQPGAYTYHCTIHGGAPNFMTGTLNVIADQHPASVSFGVSPSPTAGQPVTFTYTGSADPDGTLTAWKWDLDGDGSFETTTPAGVATATYPTARTVTVRMVAVDDSGEDSAVAQQAVAIAAGSGGAGGSGSSGSGASGSKDTTAPKATLIKLSGLKLSFRASERASATATLRARGKTIAKGSAKAKSGAITIRFKLTAAGRSVLRPRHKLKATLNLTLRDSAGNRRTVKKMLTVRRR